MLVPQASTQAIEGTVVHRLFDVAPQDVLEGIQEVALATMRRAHVCSPGLQTNVNHVPNVRSPRSPSTTKRPFTTAD